MIDLYYWFEKSTKRKASLSEYCSFCDINYRKIVKHVNTRWLSLERATTRVLQQYDALRSYFLSEGRHVTLANALLTSSVYANRGEYSTISKAERHFLKANDRNQPHVL